MVTLQLPWLFFPDGGCNELERKDGEPIDLAF